uniref:Cobalamin biosynthesis protein CbiG n=1 Tax=Clostridioides difficile TaxID=1496 RepID=A0A381KKZ9_CLODI|nr:cobalamin biosynthesis protein CbiG [Clostridioides difficile]
MVGRFLGEEYNNSSYMIRISNMNIEGNIAIICITENGKKLALKINSLVNNCVIYQVKNKKSNLVVEETCVHNSSKEVK